MLNIHFYKAFRFNCLFNKWESMKPNIQSRDPLIVSRLSHKIIGFERFDLIMLKIRSKIKHL